MGAEVLRSLKEDLHDNLIKNAESAESMENAFGLLNKAAGVMLAMEHLQFLSVVPKAEGSRD